MSDRCVHEADVMRASAGDEWSEALRSHAETCRDCAAAAAASKWMRRFAMMGDREHRLPDPSLVWLKSQLLQGTVDAAKIVRPLTVMQTGAYLLVAAAWAALVTWKWSAIAIWLRGLTPSGLVARAANAETLSMSFLMTLLALASITVMLTLHTILAEE